MPQYMLWRSEFNLGESVLTSHYLGPRDWTWVVKFGSGCLDLLRPLAGPDSEHSEYLCGALLMASCTRWTSMVLLSES